MNHLKSFRKLVLGLFLLSLPCLIVAQEPALSTEAQLFNEAERYYVAGRKQSNAYDKGRYMNYVESLYLDYLRKYSRSKNAPAARFHLGHARETLGKVKEARRTYQTVISRHKNGPFVGSAARQLAFLSFVDEDWKSAAKYFGIAANNLRDQELRYSSLTKQVQCLMKINRMDEVSRVLSKITAKPDHPYRDWAGFMLGYQAYQAEDYEATITYLEPLMAEDVDPSYRSQATFYTGLASAELGIDSPTLDHLRSVLNMPRNHPSLTPEQRKHLATNKGKAQTALMGLAARDKDYQKIVALYSKGDFGTTGKTEARRCMRAGASYLNLGKYSKARAAYRRVDRAMPNSDLAFEASFQCLVCDYYLKHPGLGERVDIFLELYKKKHAKKDKIDIAYFLKAETQFANKDLEGASVSYNRVDAEELPADFQAELFYKRGWCLHEADNHDGAIRNFSRFLAGFPEDPRVSEVLIKRGQSHASLGDRTSALRDFEEVLKRDANPELTSLALQGSGRVLKDVKKYQAMIARYRRLLSEFPNLPKDTLGNANYWVGWGYYKMDDYDQVAPYLRKAREMVPEFYSLPVGNLLVLTAFSQRDKHALHQAIQEIYRFAPDKAIPPKMLSWLGVQMFHDGQTDHAVTYLERATDLERPERTDIGVWRTLVKAQNKALRFSQAKATSELLINLEETSRWRADAQLDLAEAQLGLGDFEGAARAAQEGMDLNISGPHVAGYQLIFGEVALSQDRHLEALEAFQIAIGMVPDDPLLQPRALDGARRASSKLGDQSQADDFASRLDRQFPKWKPPFSIPKPIAPPAEPEPTPLELDPTTELPQDLEDLPGKAVIVLDPEADEDTVPE